MSGDFYQIKLVLQAEINRLFFSLHLPIFLQINISQKEYEEKYRLYLERLNGRSRNSRGMMSSPHAAEDADDNEETDDETDLHIMHTFRPSEYPRNI